MARITNAGSPAGGHAPEDTTAALRALGQMVRRALLRRVPRRAGKENA